jgi:dTMP kinase
VAAGFGTAPGTFITFEGGEGSGKSTQATLLSERLLEAGQDVLLLREPGGTVLGEELRSLLLHSTGPLAAPAELLLFLAARAELVTKVIKPALDSPRLVVCDRFSDSTFAYQGYGRGLDLATIRRLDKFATGGLKPTLTVLLDVPVELGHKRKRDDDDTFFREDLAFHERVRLGYHELAAEEPSRWLTVDGSQLPGKIGEIVADRVDQLLRVG